MAPVSSSPPPARRSSRYAESSREPVTPSSLSRSPAAEARLRTPVRAPSTQVIFAARGQNVLPGRRDARVALRHRPTVCQATTASATATSGSAAPALSSTPRAASHQPVSAPERPRPAERASPFSQ
jgi:hypothetical protein